MKKTNLGSLIRNPWREKGLDHFYWVNLDEINNVVMEGWSSMKEITTLDGDDLGGSSPIIGWGLGFASAYLI